jgi:hypothetical protein
MLDKKTKNIDEAPAAMYECPLWLHVLEVDDEGYFQ